MPEDIWQLKIPIRLALSQDEISSPGSVKPVYVLAPRLAYLPALAEQCLSFFQHVLLSLPGQPASSTPWFEFEGLALNWSQPLGVLHDLLTQQQPPLIQGQHQHQQQAQQPVAPPGLSTAMMAAIPWSLTVHYRSPPAALHNGWQNSGTAKDHFISSLKEAGYCCRGKDGCNAVMKQPGQEHDAMWAAVNKGDAATVRKLQEPLKLNPSERQGVAMPTVPVRLYIRQHKQGDADVGLIGVWDNVYSSSRPIEVQQPDGSPTLLAHLVHSVMPQHFPQPAAATAPAATCQQQGSTRPATSQQPDQKPQQRAEQQQQQLQQAADGEEHSTTRQPNTEAEPAAAHLIEAASDPLGATSSAAGGAPGSETGAATTAGDAGLCPAAAAATGASAGAAAASVSTGSVSTAAQHSHTSEPEKQQQEQPAEVSTPSTAAADSAMAANQAVLPAGWPRKCAVVVCGIQPDWCTPLGWLHANLKAADGFLYVVVHLA